GIIFELIKFPSAAALFILISMLGVIFAIPTFILFERHENGFDRVYVLIGIYIVGLLIFGLLGESVLNMMSGHIFSDLDFDFDFYNDVDKAKGIRLRDRFPFVLWLCYSD